MEKIKTNARRLDVFFRLLQIGSCIAAVAAAVSLVLIGACFLFKLDPEQVGTGYNMLELGCLELEIALGYAPEARSVLAISAVELVFGFAAALLGRAAMVRVRSVLTPMKEGLPFHENAAFHFKRLALLALVIGIVLNISEFVSFLLTRRFYHLPELLEGEGIVAAAMQWDADFSCLVVSGILLLLAYVFRYGEELQRLSDETL